eukprot:CAMPEP_0195282592 /NCGR_PEP_ID=MMETSP0707-20130614/1394_1 /TAXON_ID=33640 /ORGANISM="Asterionellopsis glacialis, Strain CCMP134" /LENGTH=261 /DNA_ID=CAMNT_0040341575 /DNA_START=17 /DNA_END=802 /DNA_ORIENTATION=-
MSNSLYDENNDGIVQQQTGTRTNGANTSTEGKLNEKLNAEHLDLDENDESSWAKLTRLVALNVGTIFAPRTMLIMLRILKAITCVFLALTVISNLMYLVYIMFFVTNEVAAKTGGSRDIILRFYGLILLGLAIAAELDLASIMKYFLGLKSFISRGLLLFLISIMTNSPNLHQRHNGGKSNYFNGGDDDTYDQDVSQEIPGSTVMFQTVTSFFIGCCAVAYFLMGIMCFDRFTTKAFVSKTDPIKRTAIPSTQTYVHPTAV